MRNAFSQAIVAAATADPKVLLLTGDHGYALFDAFRKARPDQYINCGIAEQNMVGVAAGLAKAGFKPIVYGLAAFVPIRVLEQIKMDVCYENLPVIFIGDGAGLVYSHLGTSHQSTEDIACTRSIPQLAVLSPCDRFEMTQAFQLATKTNGPVYIRMGKDDLGDIHASSVNFQSGELIRVQPTAARVAILATGSMVSTAVKVARSGLESQVWSVPSIKPISSRQVKAIAESVDLLITMEEHSAFGGMGAAISEILSDRATVPICRIGVDDRFSTLCGSWTYLMQEHQLDLNSVLERIKKFKKTLEAQRQNAGFI